MKAKGISIFIIVSLLLSGCGSQGSIYSNYREVEQLQLIRTIGIDRPDGEDVELTVSSGKTASSGPSALLSARAPSVALATQTLHDYASGKQLFYAHSKYLLLGEAAARRGVGEYLAYIQQDPALRLSIALFVVRGGTAEALMTGAEDPSYDISEVMSSVERDVTLAGDGHVFTCGETSRALSEQGAALVCALRETDTADIVHGVEAGSTAVPDGFAILRGDVLAGYLDKDEALAACLLMGVSGPGAVAVRDRDGNIATVTLERKTRELTPVWGEDGSLAALRAEIRVEGKLSELSDLRWDREALFEELEESLASSLNERVGAVLSLSQRLEADFLGLKQAVRDADSARFDALSLPWEQALAGAEMQVEVDCHLSRATDLNQPATHEGGGFLHVGEA